MGRLDGRAALITGSTRGLGLAMARAFTREGAVVGVCARDGAAAAKVARELGSLGKEGTGFALDVTDPAQVEAVVGALVSAQGGRLYILVNNAGTTRDTLLLRMTDQVFDEVIRTNLYGTFYCTRAAIKPMIKHRWGRVVNIGSVVGLMGNPGQANYAASKGAIYAFTKSIAKEVASRNITVNAISPGFVLTALTETMTEKAREGIMGQIPLGRFGTPEEIAGAAVFLASDDGAYVTGQVIQVDGGLYM